MKKSRLKVLSIALILPLLLSILPNFQVMAAPTNNVPTSSAPDDSEQWEKLTLSYGNAANVNSHNGTPLGNGYFGAKQTGSVTEDVFQLNHKEFWSGDPSYNEDVRNGLAGFESTTHADRYEAFQRTQTLLKEAYTEGISSEDRLQKMRGVENASKGMWSASYQATYLPLGYLKLNFPTLNTSVSNYQRMLDIDGATSNVSFQTEGTTYTRQAFASHPDRVMVVRLTNDTQTPMNLNVSMELPREMVGKTADNNVHVEIDKQEVVMTGRAPIEKMNSTGEWHTDRGITFEARTKAIIAGGTIIEENNQLIIRDATEILLIYSCETSYKDSFTDPSNSGIDVAGNVRTLIDAAAGQSYDDLLETHQSDYRSLFRRLWIDLEGESIRAGNTSVTPWDYARHYQYSRYIMISTERENTNNVPHTLLGLWSHDWNPSNQSAYFLNENLQKMHALVGPANLIDTSEPLWEWIGTIADPRAGGKTAKESFGIDNAWVVAHSSDIWGKTDLYAGESRWANWTSGGIWLMNDLFNAYEFTQDIDFLKNNYAIFEGAARFALGTLTQVDGIDGELKDYLVIAPSGSPEHWFLTDNGQYISAPDISTAGDVQLYQNLFNILEKAAESLRSEGYSVDESLLTEVSQAKEQMIPLELYIEKDSGRFKEWYNEFAWGEGGHRHASHLLGLYLGYTDVNPRKSFAVFEAQKKELQRLINAGGGGHPDKTYMAVNAGLPSWGLSQMTHGVIGSYDTNSVMHWGPIGASIAETILDSRFDELNLLPNLPEEWSSGEIKGIRGRGGYQMSIRWEQDKLVECVIDSPTGTTPLVREKGKGINLGTDPRFTVNRAQTTLEKLILEAESKLKGSYTQSSKDLLREALETNEYSKISHALLHLEPAETLITVTSENGKVVLTQIEETLQLTASADTANPKFVWSITDKEGKSTTAATITQDGVLTAKENGIVLVNAMLQDGSGSTGSLEVSIRLPIIHKQMIDDRDSAILYSSGWETWEESKHVNGTISYNQSLGATASLTFNGTGIEIISSKAGHLGAMEIKIDGQVVEPNISLYQADGAYALSVYKTMNLEPGQHTITITSVANSHGNTRIDLDAFIVYEQSADKTILDSFILQAEEKTASDYTTESWNTLQGALNSARIVTANEAATQPEIEQATNDLRLALDSLIVLERFGIIALGGSSSVETAAAGEIITVTAHTPPAGEMFFQWTSDDIYFENKNSQTTTFIMPAKNVTVRATFEPLPIAEHAIQIINGTAEVHSAAAGDKVSIKALDLAGKRFKSWQSSDVIVENANAKETFFTMPDNPVSLTAVFETIELPAEHAIQIINGTAEVHSAAAGDKVSIKALDLAGKRFKSWQSSDVIVENVNAKETFFTMPDNPVSLTAVFETIELPAEHAIQIINGTAEVHSAAAGDKVSIKALDLAGKRFKSWQSSDVIVENVNAKETFFTMPDNPVSLTAVFETIELPAEHAIQIVNGTAEVNSAAAGDKVSIKALDLAGKRFKSWQSSDVIVENVNAKETFFTMPDKPVSLTAVFETIELPTVTYLLSLSAEMGGSVQQESAGLYPAEQDISLTAFPAEGFSFAYWSSSSGGLFENPLSQTTIFQMPTNDTLVTAHFVADSKKPPIKVPSTIGGGRNQTQGSTTRDSTLAKDVLQDISIQHALEKTKIAVEAAKQNNSKHVKVSFRNVKNISLETLKEIANQSKLPIILQADTMTANRRSVGVRLSLNPQNSIKNISLGAYLDSAQIQATKKLFNKWFKNNLQVFELTQTASFEQEVEVAVKLDETLQSAKQLVIYTYNQEKNTYTLHSDLGWVDANGYLHFTTMHGGIYVISSDRLLK